MCSKVAPATLFFCTWASPLLPWPSSYHVIDDFHSAESRAHFSVLLDPDSVFFRTSVGCLSMHPNLVPFILSLRFPPSHSKLCHPNHTLLVACFLSRWLAFSRDLNLFIGARKCKSGVSARAGTGVSAMTTKQCPHEPFPFTFNTGLEKENFTRWYGRMIGLLVFLFPSLSFY